MDVERYSLSHRANSLLHFLSWAQDGDPHVVVNMQVPEKCLMDVAQVYPGKAGRRGFGASCREEGMAAGPAEAFFQLLVPESCGVIGVAPAALWKVLTFTLQ